MQIICKRTKIIYRKREKEKKKKKRKIKRTQQVKFKQQGLPLIKSKKQYEITLLN